MQQILIDYKKDEDFLHQFKEVNDELNKKNYKNILFHVFSAFPDETVLKALSGEIMKEFPSAYLAGSISAGEICNARLMEPSILVSALLFESTDIYIKNYEDIKTNELEIGKVICNEINNNSEIKALELIMPGTEFNTRIIFEEISKCREDITVFGGYAGGHSMEIGEHYIFNENGLTDNAIFAIYYAGKDFHIDVDKSVGWQTLGRPFTITKADESRMIAINNKPAVEIYEKYLNISRDDNFAENTFEFPLIAKVPEDELLRHTITVEPDGTLDLAGYVTEDMDIYLCFGNPSLIVRKVNERIDEVRKFQPEAILLYSCSVRKAFWENFVDMEMIPFNEIAVTSGFHTWGEVKRNPKTKNVLEYNITLLSIAMREGEPQGEPIPPLKIDDSVLKGQASLIKRLTTLVSATTEELQNAYDDLAELNDKLKYLSEYDSLTNMFNRRKIGVVIEKALEYSISTNDELSLIMLDVDWFKTVNDEYGHAEGDLVLKELADILKDCICSVPGCHVGRWGGEEFFAVLPQFSKEMAYDFAEKLRKTVEEHKFSGMKKHLTISLGVVTVSGENDQYKVFTRVDNCLYKAKERGRNITIQE